MKPVKLAILCSVLALVGCGDKNEADTTKGEQGSMTEQAKDVASTAADTAGQVASDTATATGAAADVKQAGQGAVADSTAAVEGAIPATEDATTAAATAAVIAPAAGGAAAANADLALGQTTYTGKCSACHATGAAGSPKLDDKANWAPRIAQGMDVLVKHATEGFKGSVGYMPPKGGFATLTDDEIKATVAYMVSQAQ